MSNDRSNEAVVSNRSDPATGGVSSTQAESNAGSTGDSTNPDAPDGERITDLASLSKGDLVVPDDREQPLEITREIKPDSAWKLCRAEGPRGGRISFRQTDGPIKYQYPSTGKIIRDLRRIERAAQSEADNSAGADA